MRRTRQEQTRKNRGFTLIELLVVVAIIALLISILLPSLSQARAQARTTLCMSRIAQLCKSVMLYGGDFDETPPFLGIGFENCEEHNIFEGRDTWDYWATLETWEIPDVRTAWNKTQEEWLDIDPQNDVQHGTLFQYTRFEDLYRCPEFERVANKEQDMFNYTRSVLSRKLLSGLIGDLDPGTGEPAGQLDPGPLLKFSSYHAPAGMYMLIDEQWDFHVAGVPNDSPASGLLAGEMSGYWMGHESIHGIIGDGFGSYHSVKSKTAQIEGVNAAKKGAIAYFDGHVDVQADPLPGRIANLSMGDLGNPDLIGEIEKVFNFILTQIFAQRGVNFQLEDALQLL